MRQFTYQSLSADATAKYLDDAHRLLPKFTFEDNRSDDARHHGYTTLNDFIYTLERQRDKSSIKIRTALYERAVRFINEHNDEVAS